AEDNAHHGGNGKRDDETGSVHAFDPRSGLAEVPREFKSTPDEGRCREQVKSGSSHQRCPRLASDFNFMQRC
ncbi:MAG: hypothetical protein ACXU9C_26245, partial [Xanthobacteraceae bacterium]